MRAIWKGSISFGLVDVPVKVYSATEEHDVSLHQVHDADGGRIRYERRCEICGEQVSYQHIDRAYDDGNRTVVLTDEDLRSLPAERSREIEVVEFVPTEQLDPLLFDRGYYLEPDSRSTKAYVLLRQVLQEEEHTAIARFTLRQRTRLAAVRVAGDVLLVQTLRWADEVRQPEFESLEEEPRISERELELARTVVAEMTTDFDPTEFRDDYQEELQALIEARLDQGDAVATAETFGEEDDGEVGEVIDLMEALQRSVQERRSRGGRTRTSARTAKAAIADSSQEADDDEEEAEQPPAKRASTSRARSKPAASKTAASKPAASKTAAKTPASRSAAKAPAKSSTKTATRSTAKTPAKSSTKTATRATAKGPAKSPAKAPAKTAAKPATRSTAKTAKTAKAPAKTAAKAGATRRTGTTSRRTGTTEQTRDSA